MHRPQAQSFLLRLWREHPDAPVRITIVPVNQPDERHHFATLDELCAFLRGQAGAEPDLNDDRNTAYCTPSETS